MASRSLDTLVKLTARTIGMVGENKHELLPSKTLTDKKIWKMQQMRK